ncbi:MAG: right-handed parallel beta-helix repeat-containing protein [Anaerolineae bacterium]|nr:right-handed parallel beta-helix repeat-containing protein [Phycisphaerae bacterium]
MKLPLVLLACWSIGSLCHGAIINAKPGDDLGEVVNKLRPGDELVLADGNYANVSIDFGRKWNVTVRAANVTPLKIERVDGQPIAKPASGVILSAKGKPFVFRGGTGIKLIGLTIDGCSNTLQQGAIQCDSDWTLQDVVVQRCDTVGLAITGNENHRVKNVTWTRVVTQDNGYIGMGGGFAQHVRVSDCGSFRNNRGWSHNAFADQGFEKDGKWYVHAQWEAGGGKFVHSDDVEVVRHWAEGNNGPGLWLDWNNTNIVVRDSMFLNQVWVEFDYDAMGIVLEINTGPTLIENCLFQGNESAMNVAEEHKATIRNCHIDDPIGTRNISEGGSLRNGGVQDITITDNMFYGDAKVYFWDNMDAAYRKKNRVVTEPNTMKAQLPVKWKVEGLHARDRGQ